MSFEGYYVCIVLLMMIIALAREMLRPGIVMFTALTLMMIPGIINHNEALAGFSNKGMLTIALLFIISESIRQTGAIDYLAKIILPKRKEPIPRLLYKTMLPIAGISAFFNNTPIVVIFAPMIKKWAGTMELPASKFLIPLSYATILGGICTLIGTSTNLVVDGMMIDHGMKGIGMFELAYIGIPLVIVGFGYMAVFGNLLLPGKKISKTYGVGKFREYYFDVVVQPNSAIDGIVIVRRRHELLKDFVVSAILRNGKYMKASKGEYTIEGGDRLILAGASADFLELLKIKGLQLVCLKDAPKTFRSQNLKQIEAVISPRFPGIGSTIAAFNFMSHFNAIVMAVHRNGERISENLNNLTLKEGDNLILISTDDFLINWGNDRIFYTTSYLGDITKPEKKHKMWFSIIILLCMAAATAIFNEKVIFDKIKLDMFFFAAVAVVIILWFKVLPAKEYTKSISWDILITIACSFGVSKALANSGAADVIAQSTIDLFRRFGPYGALAGIYLLTNIFTEVITNNAAAALAFPIAISAANQMGIDPKPFFIAICVAASASFSTPIGYQTNLIVQGMGNYRFTDYTKIGLPLNIICFVLSLILIPIFFHF